MKKLRVVVEVRDGIAEVKEKPRDVEVVIIDTDMQEDSEAVYPSSLLVRNFEEFEGP